jgi:hypothetical protein
MLHTDYQIQMKEILCGHGIKLNCEQFQTILLLFTFYGDSWKEVINVWYDKNIG